MRRSITIICAISSALLALSGCNSSNSTHSANANKNSDSTKSASSSAGKTADGKITVVASTNVWGSIAKEIGGKDVTVTSLINSPNQDPHDYEASAQDKLALKNAKLVIVNGGGYDDGIVKLVKTSAAKDHKLVDAVELSGLKKAGNEEFNEHVFYSLQTAKKMADKLAKDFSELDKNNQAEFLANAKAFNEKMDKLLVKAQEIGSKPQLTAVATEPVTGYLLESMKIKNVTPEEFVEQSESDAGPSAKVTDETAKLLSSGSAKLLILNGQTEDAVSAKLVKAAQEAKPAVPTVKVFETFPAGVNDYETFISQTLAAFSTAISSLK